MCFYIGGELKRFLTENASMTPVRKRRKENETQTKPNANESPSKWVNDWLWETDERHKKHMDAKIH